MKKWIVDHPYFITSVIFFVIMIFGWRVLYWREESFGFLLLLYFIVTLGIRLDDISRKIGNAPGGQASSDAREKDTITDQLNDIKASLVLLNATLGKLLQGTDKKEP
jgi:hypothetical protein